MKVKIESKHTPNQSELGKKESLGSKPFNIKPKSKKPLKAKGHHNSTSSVNSPKRAAEHQSPFEPVLKPSPRGAKSKIWMPNLQLTPGRNNEDL